MFLLKTVWYDKEELVSQLPGNSVSVVVLDWQRAAGSSVLRLSQLNNQLNCLFLNN